MFKKANMEYRRLGHTGLLVSMFGFGNYNLHELTSFEEQVKMIKTCL
jgi:aryl-alcohol dehydrogenase-like predicted oxidoreductase